MAYKSYVKKWRIEICNNVSEKVGVQNTNFKQL